MKKFLFAMLIASLLLSSAALAENCVAKLGDRLFLSANGLCALDGDELTQLDARRVESLQVSGEYIYYVVCEDESGEYNKYDGYQQILMRMDSDGNAEIIGEPRYCGFETELTDYFTEYCYYPGYGDMHVYGDSIYFIGSNGRSGSYETIAKDWNSFNGRYETSYASGTSVFRMDLNGENLTELICDVGNCVAALDVNNSRIAVASCWHNGIYAYDFSNFQLYDLNGKLVREFKNNDESRHSWIYKEDCEFTCIAGEIRTDGKTIYASFGDSEGDFINTQLSNIEKYPDDMMTEAYSVPSLLCDDGFLALTCGATSNFWDDCMKTTTLLCWVKGDNSRKLAFIPYEFGVYTDLRIGLADDMVYLCNDAGAVVRVPFAGGDVEKLGNSGFEIADEFSIDRYFSSIYLFEDSDTRLYTAEELESFSAEDLAFMRNEILARHGYVFKKAKYRDHFSEQEWYEENPNFDFSLLSEIEMANVETIKKVEAKK